MAVLPLRDIVVFPHMIVPLFVGREKSVRALEAVMKEDKQILLVAQKNASQDDPSVEDIFRVGTVSTILQLLKLPDGTVKVLVEGGRRAKIVSFKETESYFEAKTEPMPDVAGEKKDLEALGRTVVSQFEQYIKLNKKIAPEVLVSLNQIEEPSKLADTVASHLNLKIPEKQDLLEIAKISERLERVFGHMESEIGVLQVEKRIRNRVKRQMEKTQREYYLNEQLKAIQKELGEGEDGKDENAELEGRDQEDEVLQGSAREGDGGAEEAAHHEPDERRSHGGAQLPGLDAVDPLEEAQQDQQRRGRGREGAGSRPLWPGEGQGTDHRVSGRAGPQPEGARTDPVPGWAARRRQDVAGKIHRQGDRPQLRPDVAGRRARRGRGARPPADLYRLDARQGHPGHEEGQDLQPAVPVG